MAHDLPMDARENHSSRSVNRLRALVMACTVCAAAFVLFGRFAETRQTVIKIHYLGLGTLFVFLSLGEICHLMILRRIGDGAPWRRIAKTARRWQIITAVMPGAAALLILSSGLRLIHAGNYSLRMTWLFVLVAGFGALFADGILGYTPTVAALGAAGDDEAAQERVCKLVRSFGFNLMFLLHFLSLPALFLVGRSKLLPALPALDRTMTAVDQSLLPVTGSMTGVVTALLLIGIEFLAVFLLRRRWG